MTVDLSTLIERNAAFASGKPAIHFEGRTLSYAVFNERIEQAARALKTELGVNRGDRIAILSEGEIVECGTTGQIFNHPTHAYTRRLIDALPDKPTVPQNQMLDALASPGVLTVQ